jgi:hypothetical protein
MKTIIITLAAAGVVWCLTAFAFMERQRKDWVLRADAMTAAEVFQWARFTDDTTDEKDLVSFFSIADGTALRWLQEHAGASAPLRGIVQRARDMYQQTDEDNAQATRRALAPYHAKLMNGEVTPPLGFRGIAISSMAAIAAALLAFILARLSPPSSPALPLEVRARSQSRQGIGLAMLGACGLIFGLVNTIGLAALLLCGILILAGILITGFAQVRVR